MATIMTAATGIMVLGKWWSTANARDHTESRLWVVSSTGSVKQGHSSELCGYSSLAAAVCTQFGFWLINDGRQCSLDHVASYNVRSLLCTACKLNKPHCSESAAVASGHNCCSTVVRRRTAVKWESNGVKSYSCNQRTSGSPARSNTTDPTWPTQPSILRGR